MSSSSSTASAPTSRRLVLGLLGPGQVGSAFLRQVAAAAPRLRDDGHLEVGVAALATSRHMRLSRTFADPVHAAERLRDQGEGDPADLPALAHHLLEVARSEGALPLLVDTTASEGVADRYAGWLARGIHLVTANKRAGAGPMARYRDVRRGARDGGSRWRYEATVGAGLPVISTLRELLLTGDEVLAVEGVLSGTLAFLLSAWEAGSTFSGAVERARGLGYTEPDPREDLSGLDVARKLVILAREAGSTLELGQVAVEGFVPPALQEGTVEGFLGRMEEMDAPVGGRLGSMASAGHGVRYLARWEPGKGGVVGPAPLPESHPLARLGPTGNAVAFTTRRYRELPLVIQGPGAGPEVTAAGIFADLLRVAGVG